MYIDISGFIYIITLLCSIMFLRVKLTVLEEINNAQS